MSKNRIGIILLLLLLTVGFATVTANLIINNNANISSNPDDFSVIFYSASTDELSSAVISDDKKVITYNTKELVEVGDKSILEYEVKNNSSQYDADIDMNIIIPDSIKNYIRITYEGFNNIDTTNILAKEIKAGKITIELIKPVIEDMKIAIVVELNANAIERESIAYDSYYIRFHGNGNTSGDMDDQEIKYNILTQLSENEYEKEDYTFAGWTDVEGSNEIKYRNMNEIINITDPNSIKDLYAVWMKSVQDFSYNGSYYEYDALVPGTYRIELWGAQGGNARYGTQYTGGYGGYTSGDIEITDITKLYVYVGGMGVTHSGTSRDTITYNGYGYNGGGPDGVFYSGNSNGGGGGGATDVRYILDDKINDDNLLWNSEEGLKSRIMVAAGGGGADSHSSAPSWSGNGGAGGGLNGYNNPRAGSCYSYGEGATQTAAGRSVSCGSQYSTYYYSSFGVGGTIHAGGGGGYYGGGAGHHTSAGGGSSFISGHQGCNAIAESSTLESITHTGQPNHYSGLVFTNTTMIDGQGYIWTTSKGSNVKQPQPNGTTSSGHTGNGYARITFVE